MITKEYDYIIAGAGCAGLSLLTRLISSDGFSDKKILLVDKEKKNKNDRTWCFWEKDRGFFDDIVFKKWSTLWFHGEDFSKRYTITPYEYKMIRAIDFYNHCFDLINNAGNIDMMYGEVHSVESSATASTVTIDDKEITASYIFNSIFPRPFLGHKKDHHLLQHFRGWFVRMDKPAFAPGEATLMDFRVGQQEGTTFVYVMPFSENEALIEYTLFSEDLISMDSYEEGLQKYLDSFYHGNAYTIMDREYGVIPMTNKRYAESGLKGFNNLNIVDLGTAGGQTKPSTGYTFQFIQKQSSLIVENLMKGIHPATRKRPPAKFHFYDSVLLNVLATGKLAGDTLFTTMFRKNRMQDIFSFLDNESTLATDLSIISSLPVMPFLKAGIEETVKK
jgi:lycopene beta-cyclase